jgi:hypothetical protein
MAITDETIRLILDMGQSGKSVDEVKQKLDELGKTARKTADSFEVLTGELGTYAVATDQVNEELDELVRKAVEATRAQKAMAQILDEIGTKSTVNIGAFATKYRTEILNLGRVTQDFVQGGLGGILNNIEGLLVKAPALAGIATIVGTGFYLAWPAIQKWFDGLKEQADAAGGHFATLDDKLKAIGERIDELKKKKYPDAQDLRDYNQLLGQQAALEKEIAGHKKAQADYQKLTERSTEAAMQQAKLGETARREKELAKMPLEQVMGVRRDVIAGLEQQAGLPGLEAEEREISAALNDMQNRRRLSLEQLFAMGERAPKLRAQIAAARREIPGRAEEIMGGMAGGGRAGMERVLAALPRDTESFRALSKLSGEGMVEEGIRARDQSFRNIGELFQGLGRRALDKAGDEANKKMRAAADKAEKERLAEVEKMRVEGGADLVPALGGLGAALPLGERAAERAPHEARERERLREKAELEARQRAAAADILRTEGVRMEPKEALQQLEGRRRAAVQQQLDRNRELRTAEAVRRETGEPYDPSASIETLKRHNHDLMAAMERFAAANMDAAGGAAAMARVLNARAGFLEGETRQMGAPGVSGGHP